MSNVTQLPAVAKIEASEKDFSAALDESLANIEKAAQATRDAALDAARTDRITSVESLAESMRKGLVSVIAKLEEQRNTKLDKLMADRKVQDDGYQKDIKATRRAIDDLQEQIRQQTERLKGLEEARHAAMDASQSIYAAEQAGFKMLIDAQRANLSAIS